MNGAVPFRTLIWLGVSYYPALIAFWMLTAWATVMLAEGGVNAAWIGVFAAMPWVAVLVVSPLVAGLRHRLGWRGVYLLGNGFAAVAVAGFLLTESVIWWSVWAAFSGASVSLRWIIADAWAAAVTPAGAQGRMVGAFETLAGTAIAIGPGLVALTGFDPLATGVTLAGLLVVSTGAIVGVREPADVPGETGAERGVKRSWMIGGGIAVAVVFFGGLLETGAGSMMPVFGLSRGLTPELASLLMTAANASALFLQWPIGMLADRYGAMRVLRWTAVATLLASVAVALSGGTVVLFLAVFLWGGAGGGWYTLGRILASRARPDSVVEVMTALAMFYTVGAVVGPFLSGLAISAGGSTGFAVALVAVAVGLVAMIWSRRRKGISA